MPAQLSLFDIGARPADRGFFAVFPHSGAAERVAGIGRDQRMKHGLTGKALATERLHVSLLGMAACAAMPPGLVDLAMRAAAAVAMAPFDVTFDRVTSFSGKQRPLVLCGGDGLSGLIALRQTISAAMQRIGLGAGRQSFVPHLTLLYDERGIREEAVEPVSWTVTEFALVQSLVGRGRYVLLERWALRAAVSDDADPCRCKRRTMGPGWPGRLPTTWEREPGERS